MNGLHHDNLGEVGNSADSTGGSQKEHNLKEDASEPKPIVKESHSEAVSSQPGPSRPPGSSLDNPYLLLSPEDRHLLWLSRPPPKQHHSTTGEIDAEWNLPADPGSSQEGSVDKSLHARLSQFHALKSANPPTHFNASLLNNRSFRNPSIYDKLVAFIGVDERASGYPLVQNRRHKPRKEEEEEEEAQEEDEPSPTSSSPSSLSWNNPSLSHSIHTQADPRRLARLQKSFTEEEQAKKISGKRSTIDFTSSVSTSDGNGNGNGSALGASGISRMDRIRGPTHSSSSSSSSSTTPLIKRKATRDGRREEDRRIVDTVDRRESGVTSRDHDKSRRGIEGRDHQSKRRRESDRNHQSSHERIRR